MGSPWKVLVFVVLAAIGGAVAAQAPTEAEVRALIDRADRAALAQDIDTVASALSDAVQLSGTLSAEGTVVERFAYDKRAYLAALRESWAIASGATFRRSNLRIVVSGDVATATSDVAGTATVAGGTLRTQGRETVTIERVNGALVMTRSVGHATVSGEPR
jgi:ketosteroid isomerase-like protein